MTKQNKIKYILCYSILNLFWKVKNQNNIKHIAHTIQDVNIHCVGICMSWHARVESGVRNFRFLNEQIRCGHFTFFSDNWYTASWRIIINFLCCTWSIEKQKKNKIIRKVWYKRRKKGKLNWFITKLVIPYKC